MATPIQITSDTIVKILIRRGTDSERQLTVLTEGELGYCIDTQRLFVGDGLTLGGNIAGNKFLGVAADKSIYNSLAQIGDTIYQTGGEFDDAETLNAYVGGATVWENIHPKPYVSFLANTIPSLEKAQNGRWRVASQFIGGDDTEPTPSGLSIAYEDTGNPVMSLTKIPNRIDFDARYMSLCASKVAPYYNSSFYFGNIFNRTVTNNLNATINVDNSLFVNGRTSNPYQVQVYATDPFDNNASLIRMVGSPTSSQDTLKIIGSDKLSIQINGGEGYRLEKIGSTLTTTFSSLQNGSYGAPNFLFRGTPLFKNPVFFDTAADVTILGNLSVYGDTSYFDTVVTTTSALSVINNNRNQDAFVVAQYNWGGVSDVNQTIGRFQEGQYPQSVLAIRESQFVGVDVDGATNYSTHNANFVVSGGVMFKRHPSGDFARNFTVDHYNVLITGDGTIALAAHGTGNLYLSAGANGYAELAGGLRASDDIVAYSTSDIKFKTNIAAIKSPLEKLDRISGVNFDWTENAPFNGHDVGVIANEIEHVIPEAVITRGNGTKAVRYEKIIPLLIESIKELKTKIDK